jgi:hypothetical protein
MAPSRRTASSSLPLRVVAEKQANSFKKDLTIWERDFRKTYLVIASCRVLFASVISWCGG